MIEEILQEAINDIFGGNAICFVGAGFSWGAKDANGNHVPSVTQLCKEIRQFPGLEDEENAELTALAEFCNDDPELKQKLTIHLINRLTLCSPSTSHYAIMKMPWRAVFTTNFDDVAERALKESNPLIVKPNFNTLNLRADRKPLYYLHGRILDFQEGVEDPMLVLSEKNYLELKERNQNLYSALENEVHSASKIFIIGYSIRDTEIASRLFSIEDLKEKTIVICGPDEKKVELSRLKKFGTTFPIGVEKFAEQLPDPKTIPGKNKDLSLLRFVSHVKPSPSKNEIESIDIDKLILSGKFDYSSYSAQQNEKSKNHYCVERKLHIKIIFESDINRFIVTSDIGNGKSIFLDQVAFEAHRRGYEVFKITTQMTEVISELSDILASNSKRIYIIDGFVRFRKIVKHIGLRLPLNSLLVCATNHSFDDANYGAITEDMGGASKEIDLNILSRDELSNWDALLERWGLWGNRIEESTVDRIEFLRTRCGSENRSIILSLFRDTRLSTKIDEIVNFFLLQKPEYTKAFIAVLINALCQNHVEWLRITEWLNIDNSKLKSAILSSSVSDFMSGTKKWYEFSSTELASHILNNYKFDTQEIVDVYTRIVRETAHSANDPRGGFDSKENMKELMRYRFLTRLFSNSETGEAAITAVYQRLSNVQRIRNNDQFWLQYAMAKMEVNDLPNAETYLKTARGLADKRGEGYSKHQIIDQQIRLIFRKNSQIRTPVNKQELVEASNNLVRLLKSENVTLVHPLRSSAHLLELLEQKADKLDGPTILSLKDTVELMRTTMPEGNLQKAQRGETEVIRKNLKSCALILGSL